MISEDDLISPALHQALSDVPPSERDAAAVKLALRYARLLDRAVGTDEEAAVVAELGPKLLQALTSLGMTVAGRDRKGGQANAAPQPSALDELRARAKRRAAG